MTYQRMPAYAISFLISVVIFDNRFQSLMLTVKYPIGYCQGIRISILLS